MKRDWIFVHAPGGDHTDRYGFECERCRSVLTVLLPVSLEDFVDASMGFQIRHRRCMRSLHGERCQLLGALRRRANPAGGSFTITLSV
jgi:hypothetical protein